jgi:CDP-diacylglycerol--glycerol-3-phosphate 3-phosphatidyltransferase
MYLVAAVLVAALLAEFAGVLAVMIGVSRRFDGPMGKSDRAFVFSLIAILIGMKTGSIWLNGLLYLTLILSIGTIVNRLRQALRFSVQQIR